MQNVGMSRMLRWGLSLGSIAACGLALAHDGTARDHAPPDALAITTLVRTGEGEHTFENVPNWCKIPGGKPDLGSSTHGGVVEDKAGLIYFTMDSGPHAILVYKPD